MQNQYKKEQYSFRTLNGGLPCPYNVTVANNKSTRDEAMRRIIREVLLTMGILAAIGSVFGCGSGKGPAGTLAVVRYSPGYSDMSGGAYSTVLKKDDDGRWIIEENEREDHSSPTHVIIYSVSEEDVAAFETFIREKKVYALQNRKDSDDFVTDYSPWGYRMEFKDMSDGKKTTEYVDISEYKKYSDSDYKLIKELRERLMGLKGEKISERHED